MFRSPCASLACGLLLAAASLAPPGAAADPQLICNERPVTGSSAEPTPDEILAGIESRSTHTRTAPPAAPAAGIAVTAEAATWRLLPGPITPESPIVLDALRDRILCFGTSAGPASVQVRALHPDSGWRPLPTAGSAPAIGGPIAVLDAAHDRVVMFGGRHDGGETSEVWALSLDEPATWAQLVPPGAGPGGRISHCAAYDPVRHRLVVFGGWGRRTDASATAEGLDDTWVLDLDGTPGWSEVVTTIHPGLHYDGSLVYDPARDRMVLHGWAPDAAEPATWTLSLSGTPEWAPVVLAEPSAVRRRYHAAVMDPAHDRMVVYSGSSALAGYNDVWSLSFATLAWESLATAGPVPTHAAGPRAVFDPARGRMIVGVHIWDVTSYLSTQRMRVLSLDETPTWSELRPGETVPLRRYGHVAAMDERRHRAVVMGGRETHYEPKYTYPATFFGDAAALSDPPTEWTNPVSGSELTPRAHHAGAIDTRRDRLLVFGGRVGSSQVNEVWAMPLAGGAWEFVSCAGAPPAPREGASAIYDPVGDRLLVYGAAVGDLPQDVWELAFASGTPGWNRLRPAGGPGTGRSRHAAVYDPQLRRMIVMGGSYNSALATAWAFELDGEPRWTSLPAIPGARYYHAACFDTRRNRTLVFGGKSVPTASDDAMNDVVALPNGGGEWNAVVAAGAAPLPRYATAAVYDSLRDRMLVLYGTSGYCSEHTYGDVWELTFDVPTAAAVSLVSSEATPDEVRLAWVDAAGELAIARVERSTATSGWAETARLAANGTGWFEWIDRDVAPGGRYGYRLAYDDGDTARIAGETWIDVPQRLSLALAHEGPNPSSSILSVRLSLPGPSPATLEVFDVSGRRLARQAVGALGAGTHVTRVDASAAFPAGVYRLRLTQSGRTAEARAVLIR